MTCPVCKSELAVSKVEAWDALSQIPPQTRSRLEYLETIALVANDLAAHGKQLPDEETAYFTIRKDLFDNLQLALFGVTNNE